MAAADLYNDALSIVASIQVRAQNGSVNINTTIVDLCTAIQLCAQAGLNVTPSTLELDPGNDSAVSTEPAQEALN